MKKQNFPGVLLKSVGSLLTFLVLLLTCQNAFSQKWVDMMEDPHANFYDIQKEFNMYWEQPDNKKLLDEMKEEQHKKRRWFHKKEEEENEIAGWQHFKRWESLMEPRVYPSGKLLPPDDYFEFVSTLSNSQQQRTGVGTASANWTLLGPSTVPNYGGGAGRVQCVRFDPSNSNIVYAGSGAGGLWKSTNGGSGWTMWNTDALGSLGVGDFAIDPTNTQVMYIGSGDPDANHTNSLGVLKSTNGGTTWNTSGLNWTTSQGRNIRRILIDPSNTQIIHVASNVGVYRSTNGGASWTQTYSAGVRDMEFKPGDPTTIYAVSSNNILRSNNSGGGYATMSTIPGAGRLALAVTAANSNYLYVLASNSSNNTFLGLYLSTDAGTSFTTRSTSPNILGYSNVGSDATGQGWYDLSVAASPTNANEVVVGGVNIWKSTNAGINWGIIGHWTGSGAPYVHSDVHDLIYKNATTIYAGCDGGVFQTPNNGGSWSDMSTGLVLGQMYGVSQSVGNSGILLAGLQDNGTDRLWSGAWDRVMGGDGMICFIDRTNVNTMYAEYYNGNLQRSTNGGGGWGSIQSGLFGSANWVTPWVQDPVSSTTLWVGYTEVFKSTNQGTNWSQAGTIGGSGTMIAIDVAPSNNQYIYAARINALFMSNNGGGGWINITGTLPTGSAAITNIEIDPANPNHVWVTFSGYSSGNKIFESTNGGSSWTNFSSGLPNIPVNCITYEKNSANGNLYAGTDLGVYYRDNTLSSWVAYNSGLPNVIVKGLEIHYGSGLLRAATFGRGIWETSLNASVPPSNLSTASANCPQVSTTLNWQNSGTNWFVDVSDDPTYANYWNKSVSGVTSTPCPDGFQNFSNTSQYLELKPNTTYYWRLWDGSTHYNGQSFTTPSCTYSKTTCSGTFEDTGGPSAAYGSNEDYLTIIQPAGASSVTMNFTSFDIEPNFDSLWIYNGATTASPLLGVYTGTVSPGTVVANSGKMTVRFKSDPFVDNAGWSATWSSPGPNAVASANGPVCAGQTINLSATTISGAGYSWAGPNGYSSSQQNPSISNATTAAAGTYTLTVSTNGCSNTSTVSVTVNNLPNATASANGPVCAGQTINLSASTVSGAGYSWVGPNGFSSSQQNPSISNATTAAGGTYTLTVNANGCSKATTVVVTVNNLPNAVASVNGPVCAGQTINLSASTVSGAGYSWTGPNGFSSSQQNPNISNATTAAGGTYTLTVSANGCSKTTTVAVTVNSLPNAVASANGPVCAGQTINLSASTVSGAGYSWVGPNGFSSSQQNPSISNAGTAASGTYTLTVSANGCNNTSTVSVTVNNLPNAVASANGPVCAGQTINLSATTVSGAGYSWVGPNGFSSLQQNPSISNATVAASGTYSLTVSSNGCQASSSVNVTVHPNPVTPTITAVADTLHANPSSGYSYQWYFNGSIITGATSSTYIAMQAGNYSVVITDANTCSSGSSSYSYAGTTGVRDFVQSGIDVFPNPFNESATIIVRDPELLNAEIKLFDVRGRELRVLTPVKGTSTYIIERENLSAGLYFILVHNAQKSCSTKIMIE